GEPIGSFASVASINPSPQRMQQGYDQHWSFGVQQQLNKSLVFDASYVGNRGVLLGGRQRINLPEPGPGSIAERRPFPRFGSINFHQSNGNNIYHSLQTKLEQRRSSGL